LVDNIFIKAFDAIRFCVFVEVIFAFCIIAVLIFAVFAVIEFTCAAEFCSGNAKVFTTPQILGVVGVTVKYP